MAHVRQLVRDAFRELLSGVTGYSALSSLYPTDQVPRITVSVISESIESATEGNWGAKQRYFRDISMAIEVLVQHETDVEDMLDDKCAEIETLIETDRATGDGVLKGLLMLDLTSFEIERPEDAPRGTLQGTLFYQCRLQTLGTDPETIRSG